MQYWHLSMEWAVWDKLLKLWRVYISTTPLQLVFPPSLPFHLSLPPPVLFFPSELLAAAPLLSSLLSYFSCSSSPLPPALPPSRSFLSSLILLTFILNVSKCGFPGSILDATVRSLTAFLYTSIYMRHWLHAFVVRRSIMKYEWYWVEYIWQMIRSKDDSLDYTEMRLSEVEMTHKSYEV